MELSCSVYFILANREANVYMLAMIHLKWPDFLKSILQRRSRCQDGIKHARNLLEMLVRENEGGGQESPQTVVQV